MCQRITMGQVLSDDDAWRAFKEHRHLFNKLAFSEKMGHYCGPCGVAPDISGFYVVRPIYNLAGMGLGARKQWIEAGDKSQVEPGYFWCEWFDGPHTSVTYEWRGYWKAVSAWRGYNYPQNLSRFVRWERCSPITFVRIGELEGVNIINVEFIGDKPIEVHLRPSPDPDDVDVIIPVWADSPQTEYVPSFDDGDGFLKVPRLGFMKE